MAAFAGDFDDPEDESASQPLPAEDRLWRHPSELGSLGWSLPLDPITVRRRWLASQPSKASAWTAGLVGAILATGLVALGTHLASAITQRGAPTATDDQASPPASVPAAVPTRLSANGIGTDLAARIEQIGKSIVRIDVTRGSSEVQCLGVGIRADGLLLAPAAEVAGASSITVLLADGTYYVGEVIASDSSTRAASSGLALVHISTTHLPVAPLDAASPAVSTSTLAVALTSPGGATMSVGSVSTEAPTTIGHTVLVDAMATDLAPSAAPAGSVLLDASGQILGIVTASDARGAIITPAWIASIVSAQLLASGAVDHGWLGIEGVTVTGTTPGVRVTAVEAKGAASEAGLLAGDTITSVDGHDVASMAQLQSRLYFTKPGADVAIGYLRGGQAFRTTAVLDDQKKL